VILVDTSAWIEFDRATGSAVDDRLTNLIANGGGDIAVTEPILMEILAGAKSERRHDDLRRLVSSFGWIPCDPVADFEGAARVYRSCRAAGITPRGLIDCMIIAIALRTSSKLLTTDGEFETICRVLPLKLVELKPISPAAILRNETDTPRK
jgi:predicted nucleic acid-binding protein